MKGIYKKFTKRLCCMLVAIAMVLSMVGSHVVTVYASETGEASVILDASANGETEGLKSTPGDATAEVATPLDGTVINAGIVTDPPLNGAPTDTPIDVVDLTIAIPKLGEVNPTASVVTNGEGYTITVGTSEHNNGWCNPAGSLIGQEGVQEEDLSLLFIVTPKTGYTLTQDTEVWVNGSTDNVNKVGGYDIPASQVEFKTLPQIDGDIDVIDLTGVPTPVIGGTADAYSATGTNYSITGAWYVFDTAVNSYKPVDAAHTFADGNIYKLEMIIKPDVGYRFTDETYIEANTDYSSAWHSRTEFQVDMFTSFATVIEEAYISGDNIPKAEVGKSFENKSIEIPVTDGSNYKVVGHWVDEDGNGSGTFENGKVYFLYIEIYPNAGYSISEDLALFIDDEYHLAGISFEMGGYTMRQSLATAIDKVYVSNLPEANVGEIIKKGEIDNRFTVDVPADANYTAVGWWRLSDGSDMTETTFQSGKSYQLVVAFEPKDGYDFADSLIVNDDGIEHGLGNVDAYFVFYELTYSFQQVIDEIRVEGVKEPIVGEKATTDTIKTPADANYEIIDAVWYDNDLLVPVDTFEEGHEYKIEIEVRPKDGYEFDVYADTFVNGEIYREETYVDSDYASIYCCYTSFETVISEVRVDNVPEMKIGEKAQVEATIPADANYIIQGMRWMVWDDKQEEFVVFDGIFEAGKCYRLMVYIGANEGYRFDKDNTVVYVNGAVDESVNVHANFVTVGREYSEGLKVIDRVEVTVKEPVVGQHSSILPIIAVSEGANYKVHDNSLTRWLVEKKGEYRVFDGYFADGESYGVNFDIVPAEGYVFAENVLVIINDTVVSKNAKPLNSKLLETRYYFDVECDHIYGDWADAKDGTHVKVCDICGHKVIEKHAYDEATGQCNVCEAKKPSESTGGVEGNKPGAAGDGNPATGDSFAMSYVLALMSMCGAGIYVLDRKRRKADYEE
ncbi:MAG: hypothetical protein IJZ96_06025 [Lachnospiraceae bacterium]|nr:hypothetical protein [Lachnospiraceae bacterium]